MNWFASLHNPWSDAGLVNAIDRSGIGQPKPPIEMRRLDDIDTHAQDFPKWLEDAGYGKREF